MLSGRPEMLETFFAYFTVVALVCLTLWAAYLAAVILFDDVHLRRPRLH
jgi:hypothetical protein